MKEGLRVLLVEDSSMDEDLLVRHLRSEKIDFEYIRVWTKDDFLLQLREFAPNFVISDYVLPQFSGIEAFRSMGKEGIHLPFILLTGTVSEFLVQQMMKEGIDDYMLKDDISGLSRMIKDVIDKRRGVYRSGKE